MNALFVDPINESLALVDLAEILTHHIANIRFVFIL